MLKATYEGDAPQKLPALNTVALQYAAVFAALPDNSSAICQSTLISH